ncbi:heterokaryon incompatibility protein-domain-containing protein [Pyrenochaeta sp. MPI-SDFR-AT-0127]|nr:heterokaryon incompatibility protein-domain-containing protein [Pyrenochaeta sp. MPI-SDFR-AT-0127]
MASKLIHYPLKLPKDIRLLRIQPRDGQTGIKITSEIFNLDSDVEFTAISYVWGDLNPPNYIVCNGQDLCIAQNLSEVLLQLQNERYCGLLWADAICINQKDMEEKSIQVSMMREIYQRATKVIFWLGKEEKHDNRAVCLMKLFCERRKIHTKLDDLRAASLSELCLPPNDDGWRGWASLLSRPWFGRVWIVQEFLNASHSVFMSGALEISTEVLIHCAHATGVCLAIGNAVALASKNTSDCRDLILRPVSLAIDEISRSIDKTDDVRIVDLWTKSQLLGATDARDRVFALLSTQTAVRMDLVDYKKTEEDVYIEIATIALNLAVRRTNWYKKSSTPLEPHQCRNDLQRTCRFLACKLYSQHPSGLPSWVPDWKPAAFRFVPLTRYYPGYTYFKAHYRHATIVGKILSISGAVVDSPYLIIDSMPYMDLFEGRKTLSAMKSRLQNMLHWQLMCWFGAQHWNPVAKRAILANKADRFEAFCRTMAFNSLSDRGVTSDAEYITGFQAFYSRCVRGTGKSLKRRHDILSQNNPSSHEVIFESLFLELSAGRKFCVTNNGSLAWVPMGTKLGDHICFLAGCAVPFVIRSVGTSYELLGDCYLHDMMSYESIMLGFKPEMFQFQ